ncbi:MAG: FtsW/RodA/SpoVE family cell cycle protein [Lachnospiraceae bacterium]|nr:FtsW/RodA/SpoVE family cell cycle protein [Lachnospiraceae bacterium]
MLKAVIELSKYILVVNILLYTLISYLALRVDDRERKGFVFVLQCMMILINHVIGSLVLLFSRQDFTYLFFPMFQMLAVFAYLVLMRAIYPKSNRLILCHIAMLLSVGFVILTRLSITRSVRQFIIVAASLVIGLIVPSFMKHFKLIKRSELILAAVGVVVLSAVLVSGRLTNGSKLSFSVFGLSFQPSEFVKIIYVIFIACILARAKHFGHILLSAVLAAAHVLILVASKDLGSALIFFITYVLLLFAATKKLRYLIAGLAGAAAASYVSYFLFSHVRVRVEAWLDPWNDINATGYQIAQSLFGIGTGGWFGMGIDAGNPSLIPYVEQDFIFSAVCEEYGVIFGICLIAICVNLFLEIVRVAHSCLEPFVKYACFGLGVVYVSQLFLTIGGNTKFIPLTGVTLPLISYGGSSVLASVMMLSVVQGFYVNRDLLLAYEGEDEEDEEAFVPYMPRRYMNATAGVFAALFVGICVYLVHFVYFDSPRVINNAYNTKRQEILAAKTTRGDILSADGKVLATTLAGSEERYYPYSELYAHVIGYASNGRMGVEQNANIYLVSSNVSLNSKLSDDLANEKHMGNTVVTTLDSRLQELAYNALGMYDGAVLVTEPETGKILAMVSKPDFDPNTIEDIWDEVIIDEESSILVNRVTQGLYPPGSTFKILTALAYIRENPYDYEQYKFDCSGQFKSGENVINCFHGTKHGKVDFSLSFAKSCNASFANIGLSLERNSFQSMLDALYFNEALPVDFLSNKSSISENIAASDNVMIQTAIGQGETQMTPLHVAMITAMIANKGEMMQPYLIDYVQNADGGKVISFEPKSLGQLISETEADALKALMRAVVVEGTGTRIKSDVYSVAGKTGSAEYNSKSDSHAWFTGFTYDTDRPLQITVIMEGAGSGGEYAVPVARRILDGYYGEEQ